ncbi:MAG TPA: iron ABC transporter permease [Micropepsaceae bacterium]|jgi:iron complex transport system permease protein
MTGVAEIASGDGRPGPGARPFTSGFPVAAPLIVILCVLAIVSLLSGRVWLSPQEVWDGIFSSHSQLSSLIVIELRLPRTVLAIMVGATLGLCGAVLQGFTRNPLAEPGLLGVSAGASFGAVIAIYFGISLISAVAIPVCGLIGALAAMSLTFAIGGGGGTVSLVLAGAAVNAFLFALISLGLNLAPSIEAAYEIMTWLMGSLANRSWDHVLLVTPFIVAGCAMLAFTGRSLDALSLGEIQAESLGVNLRRLSLIALIGTALAVGAATSVTGTIGFIGLVGPHLVRPFVGYQPSRILFPAALAGAVLLLAADIATRWISIGPEMKLGVFTALVGTPVFFWLVMRLRRVSP